MHALAQRRQSERVGDVRGRQVLANERATCLKEQIEALTHDLVLGHMHRLKPCTSPPTRMSRVAALSWFTGTGSGNSSSRAWLTGSS